MNNITSKLIQVAALTALSTGFGLAQSADDVKATVPFDFSVGNKTMPAGEYTIKSAFGSPVVQICDSRNVFQTSLMAIRGSSRSGPADSQLVFRVHGTKHYLASMWNGSTHNSRALRETPAEREAEMAAGPTTRTVLIAHK